MATPRRQGEASDATTNPNVFDDEYETDVPDAALEHRPVGRTAGQEPEATMRARSRTPPPQETAAERRSRSNRAAYRAWRSSIAKDPRDLVGARSAGTARALSQERNRPISTASSYAHFEDRSNTPVHVRGGSGYEVAGFSQSGLPRLSSASHSPPMRPSEYSQTAPAFPYALYNQATLPAEDDASVAEPAAVIGFPGTRRNNDFHRRIGPDGEEQDIVGPDGHTEQLPPYSKYPDGHARAPSAVAAAAPSTAPAAPSVEPGPTSPLVEAPPRAPSLASGAQDSSSVTSLAPSEKKWKEKTFTERRRTRVCCGIPLWMLATVIGAVFLCAVIIGGVVGGLFITAKNKNPPTVTVTSSATLLDASPIASPTGIKPIPTGVFEMPFGIPQEQQKSCITQGAQLDTWACNTPDKPMVVRVGTPPSQFQYMDMWANLTQPVSNESQPLLNMNYGAQYPTILTPQRLYWVEDLEDPSRGPALHFQTLYDKLVILKDDQFRPAMVKRDDNDFAALSISSNPPPATPPPLSFSVASGSATASSSAPSSFPTDQPEDLQDGPPRSRKNSVDVGERPWFCWWNQTWIEGFVYMQTYTPPVIKNAEPQFQAYKRDVETPTTTTPPLMGDWSRKEIKERDADFGKAQAMYRSAMDGFERRWADPIPSPSSSPSPSPPLSEVNLPPVPTTECDTFPYVMKIQERRIPCDEDVAPYCQRMFIPPNGPPVPLMDLNGLPIIVPIQEDSPSFEVQLERFKETASASSRGSKSKRGEHRQLAEMFKRDDLAGSCHCHWVTPPLPS